MRKRSVLLVSAALIGLPISAQAQQTDGFFIEGQGGVNWIQDLDVFPGTFDIGDGLLAGTISPVDFDTGWAASGQVGYGFGNGLIVEGEVTYRSNDGNLNVSGLEFNEIPFSRDYSFDVESWAFMANVLYEFNPIVGIHPYIGAGAGIALVDAEVSIPEGGEFSDDDTGFAAQAIAGVRVPITPRLSAVVDYRFFNVFDIEFDSFGGSVPGVPATVEDDLTNHTIMAGLRYTFTPPPPPPPAPVIAPVAETAFIVFFDWDRADLTPEANLVLDDVVVTANQGGFASVRLDGYTDLSGSPAYNLGLSERRANSVADGLIARGIAPDEIVIRAFGEENPLVPTPDGVREPQNRRVEIFLT